MSVEWVFFAFTLDDSNANFYKWRGDFFGHQSSALARVILKSGETQVADLSTIAVYNQDFHGRRNKQLYDQTVFKVLRRFVIFKCSGPLWYGGPFFVSEMKSEV